ncbi:HigA family addiction module antitoxin [Nguyenibacter vanlangensis]|uniref:HigA family addiction module antitoxin n=1 Tax=Nguyenibacter vanlangensis TaxID=1216886 RepID=A0ABZ3D129_9PROT
MDGGYREDTGKPPLPGEILDRCFLSGTGKSRSEIALLLGISRPTLWAIIKGKAPIRTPTAARLGRMFGTGAAFWLHLQADHDAWNAERNIDLSGIPTLQRKATPRMSRGT